MLRKFALVVGLVPLLACTTVFLVPSLRTRFEGLPRRAETWWAEQQPHDMFVPPPAEVAASGGPPSDFALPTAPIQLPAAPATGTPLPITSKSTPQSTTAATTLGSVPTKRPVVAVVVAPAPGELKLTVFRHEYQGWNNCGPVTLGMLLSHYGYAETQKELAPLLKPNDNDKNVSPNELAGYILTHTNLGVTYRVSGSVDQLKLLLANGFPVIVETWFLPQPNDGMGHYRLLIGYNDQTGKFAALDSYTGPNEQMPYASFDADWKAFNRVYLVVYRPEQLNLLNAILNGAQDDATNWQQARQKAESDIAGNPADSFAWHNLGASLHHLGQESDAITSFDRARKIGLPWRMLWYQFDMFETYLSAGRFQDVLDLAAANLRQAGDLEESYYYRGRALQALGRSDEAIRAYRDALKYNKYYAAPAKALGDLGVSL